MSANLDLERRLADFYASEAPPRAPDWVLGSVLSTIDTIPQRRALIRVPWRFQTMNSLAKLAVAAVAVIAVGAVGLSVLRPSPTPDVGGGQGSPVSSPTPLPSSSPAPSVSPALTETFTSAMHGISVSYPAGWSVRPATELWTAGLPFQGSAFADVIDSRNNNFILAASQPLAGKSGDQWAADLSSHADWDDTCTPDTEPVIIDGITGLLEIHCPNDGVQSAFAWVEDRGYLIIGYDLPSLEYLKAILATVKFHPEDAINTAPASP
jgi:hypothetical protein